MEFKCEIACRTSSISGCNVVLSNSGGGKTSSVNVSTEDIKPQLATVVINNVDPMRSYMYFASAVVIVNRTIITTPVIRGIIPALIISPTTCKSMSIMQDILYMHYQLYYIRISIS